MKKQPKTKKLSIQRETLTTLSGVTGGIGNNNTVYYPPPTSTCPTQQQTQQNA